MGSVSTHDRTELQLALDELGVTSGHNKVLRKAAGGRNGAEKLTWFLLANATTGEKFIALTLTSRGQRYGAWCKAMDESVGPCYYAVPDAIWNERPENPQGQFAIEWYERVAAYKAQWPLSLDQVPVGASVRITEYPGTWTRYGTYNGQPTFNGEVGDKSYRNTRLSGWKSLRATIVVADGTLEEA